MAKQQRRRDEADSDEVGTATMPLMPDPLDDDLAPSPKPGSTLAEHYPDDHEGGAGDAHGVPGLAGPRAGSAAAPVPCVGLPVLFQVSGKPIAGILTRQSALEPDLWDLATFIPGAQMLGRRFSVRYSPTPRDGYWTFLPGWQFTG